MPRHLYTTISQVVLVDQITQAPSAINFIDGFSTTTLPSASPSVSVISCWLREKDTEGPVEARHRFVSPDGDEILTSHLKGGQFGANGIARQIHIVGTIPLKVTGRHWLVVELRKDGHWTEVVRLPIDVTQASKDELDAARAKRVARLEQP